MALTHRLARLAGARGSRRLSRSLPFVGSLIALGFAGMAIRRKGLARGVADTSLNALPFIGVLKTVIETFTGDWFRDRPRRPSLR
jgi:hypothetical protein